MGRGNALEAEVPSPVRVGEVGSMGHTEWERGSSLP